MNGVKVLVVGGYGAVGATITRTLAESFPGRVVCAGRDPARARALAAETTAAAARVDVTDRKSFERTLTEYEIGLVVLGVEPPGPGIARACLERGIHVVDVGASDHLLTGVEALAGLATANAATAVLSVGLAPGLTNILARRAHDDLGGADRLEITVLLGAGERHGADAVRWTLDGLATPDGASAPPAARVVLPGFGPRTAHPFPFSDQHSLRRTLGVADVTTRLCLDSAALTAVLFGLRRTGVLRASRRPRVRRALTAAMTRVHAGSDGFAVRADAFRGGRHAAHALTGHTQSRVTGLVAAAVARHLLTEGLPAAVHHLEQLPGFAGLPESLAVHGVHVWRRIGDR